MLTIFGKKKKDDSTEAAQTTDQSGSSPPMISISQTSSPQATPFQAPTTAPSPSQSSSPQFQPQPQAVMRPAPAPQVFRASPNAPIPTEETSLTRLLQSLLADIPLPPDVDPTFGAARTTPDFVPVRSTPPSRPMVIGPTRDSGEWEEAGDEGPGPNTPPLGKPVKPAEGPPLTPKVTAPTPPMTMKKDQAPDKTDKSPKVEKQPEAPAKPSKVTRTPQGFEHIFQLTQGNLENTGLVIINGEAGSGRTTLCSGLTSNYMKAGSPCLYLTCDQAPSALRDQMKKLGTDASQFESGFRLIVVDGFASQSESFSMEMYYVDQPFNFDTVAEALVRNIGMFVGEKVRIIFDSLDNLASKVQGKDFTKGFTDLAGKLKNAEATFIVTVDLSKLSKDQAGSLNDLADCIVDLSKDDSDPNGREIKVQRLNHSPAKVDSETFEIDANKGLVFV